MRYHGSDGLRDRDVTSGWWALTIAFLEAAYRSAEEGRPVQVAT